MATQAPLPVRCPRRWPLVLLALAATLAVLSRWWCGRTFVAGGLLGNALLLALLAAAQHWLARQLAAVDPIERLLVMRDIGTLVQLGALYLVRGLGLLLVPAAMAGRCAGRWRRVAPQPRRLMSGALLLSLLMAGCADSAPPAGQAHIVLGVSADAPLMGAFERVRVVVTNNLGAVLLEQERPYDGSQATEFTLPAVPDNSQIRATVMAYAAAATTPLLTRVIETRADASRTMLLRVRFNDECLPKEGERDVSCAGTTCSAGVCVVPFISPYLFEDYRPDWAEPPQGYCGPVDAGEPLVTIGRAEAPFTALQPGDIVTPQMGLQGASHFFFSVRMRNADDNSPLTHYYGTILATGRETNVVSVADRYVVNAAGCELFMVPMLLPPEDVSNETMRLGVTLSDITGNAGHSHIDIELAPPLPP